MDIAGETHNDLVHDIYKTRLDPDGNEIHIEKTHGIYYFIIIIVKKKNKVKQNS